MKILKKMLIIFSIFILIIPLEACELEILNPSGLVAIAQKDLIITSFLLMLLIVIPVMISVVFLAIKYRSSNVRTEYLPDWEHSTKIEIFMWGIPIFMVTILAIMSFYFTHKYEPSKSLTQKISFSEKKISPLKIYAVALEWKWLFIYPDYGIASINEIYAPTGAQVFMQLTAQDAINAFWVPKLGTVLYAMPQMNSKLYLLSEKDGVFRGVSSNYSGSGFSGMNFKWYSVQENLFNRWISNAKNSFNHLDRKTYLSLTEKTTNNPIIYFSEVDKDLYYRIVNRCLREEEKCNDNLMNISSSKTFWEELSSSVR